MAAYRVGSCDQISSRLLGPKVAAKTKQVDSYRISRGNVRVTKFLIAAGCVVKKFISCSLMSMYTLVGLYHTVWAYVGSPKMLELWGPYSLAWGRGDP